MVAERIAQFIYFDDVAILVQGQSHTNIARELGKLIYWLFDIPNRDGAGCWLSGGTDDHCRLMQILVVDALSVDEALGSAIGSFGFM